jgi:hypothetical protein
MLIVCRYPSGVGKKLHGGEPKKEAAARMKATTSDVEILKMSSENKRNGGW